MPDNIDFLKHTKFIMNNFQEGIRTESVMIVADNVLKPDVFHKLRRITDEVSSVKAIGENGEEVTLQKLCFKWVIKFLEFDCEIKIKIFLECLWLPII